MDDERLVSDLLTPLWQGISPDYKRQYARNIWGQFEDNIRSAAYTAQLSKFLEKITLRLNIDIRAEYVERVAAVVNCGEDKVVLKALREETALLVLLVRAVNEERREKYEAKHKKGGRDENVLPGGESHEPELNLT